MGFKLIFNFVNDLTCLCDAGATFFIGEASPTGVFGVSEEVQESSCMVTGPSFCI